MSKITIGNNVPEELAVDALGTPADNPLVAAKAGERRLVFISHANPDDNDFALWLGARLTAAGYEVWADVINLMGGETFWRDIGSIIREHAALFLVAISRASFQRDGVLNEIAIAAAAQRNHGLDQFVIPLKLDDLPYSDYPEQIIRRNAIDFSINWADGLRSVLKVLGRETIRREETISDVSLETWLDVRARGAADVALKDEELLSNWFAITKLPDQLNFSRFNANQKQMKEAHEQFSSPTFPYLRLVGSFAETATLQLEISPSVVLEHAYRVPLQDVLDGSNDIGLTRQDGRNMVTSLLRQGWECFAAKRGLQKYEFAYGTGWFLPLNVLEGNYAEFTDLSGRKRRRLLVGRSNARDMYWHFAANPRVLLAEPARLMMRAQIVFSKDGKTPLDSKVAAFRLRRSFCKMWWNDRWRDLVRSFASYLAEGGEEFPLLLGGDSTAVVSTRPMTFRAPVSIPDDLAEFVEDVTEESEADMLDDLDDPGPQLDDDEDGNLWLEDDEGG